MLRMQSIVVASDFSPASKAALDWAVAFASQERARLLVLHVCEPPRTDDPACTPPPGALATLVASAARELERSLAPLRARVHAAASIRVGEPRDTILACANEMQADLIVMGVHGRHDMVDDRLGCVTREVVHHAECPVLTIREQTLDPVKVRHARADETSAGVESGS